VFIGRLRRKLDPDETPKPIETLRGRGYRFALAQMVALISSAEAGDDGQVVPRLADAESRLATPGSGLYARVSSRDGDQDWRSPSATGTFIDFGPTLPAGGRDFRFLDGGRSGPLAAASRGLRWDDESGRSRELTFTVATGLASYADQLASFRSGLLRGFGVLAALLLLTLAVLLRWVLRPLRQLAVQIREVESGARERLDARWPTELAGVVQNLNALLDGERTRIARYRDTLGNLAHSLKTPLAVLRATMSAPDAAPVAPTVNAEVDRMNAIVEHQLKRAAASGGAVLGQATVALAPLAQDLRAALMKVHARKDFGIELALGDGFGVACDRDDLMEALGNLMDNAAKWCRGAVRVSSRLDDGAPPGRRVVIDVEDDGPGIRPEDRSRVGQRGVRTDELTPGHGIGLSMVREMAELYGGSLAIGESALGGACVTLRLPGR
jgi:two-component system, OmpR family, sensor histidine kinase PhoQ